MRPFSGLGFPASGKPSLHVLACPCMIIPVVFGQMVEPFSSLSPRDVPQVKHLYLFRARGGCTWSVPFSCLAMELRRMLPPEVQLDAAALS